VRRIVAACVSVVLFLICSAPTSAQRIVGRRTVVAGLSTFQVRSSQPNVAYVAEVAPDALVRMKVATTKWPADRRATTSHLCGDCLVAVNGGFFSMRTGLPVAGQWPSALASVLDPARRAAVHTVQWLVKDGKTWPFASTSFALGRHPRTFVFGNPEGTMWLAAVDGRRPGYSLGMTLPEVVAFARGFGASWVVNLDGGCSTTFVVDGVVKNHPCVDSTSVGGERPVANAMSVMPA
jgi:hypothetical protein